MFIITKHNQYEANDVIFNHKEGTVSFTHGNRPFCLSISVVMSIHKIATS